MQYSSENHQPQFMNNSNVNEQNHSVSQFPEQQHHYYQSYQYNLTQNSYLQHQHHLNYDENKKVAQSKDINR